MSRRRQAAATAPLLALLVVGWWLGPGSRQPLVVAPGEPVGRLAGQHPGAVLVLAPGDHDGFDLRQPATVRGQPGAVVRGEITVEADGARLEDVAVVGGDNGVTVRGVDGVVLERVTVEGARLHGIEIIQGSAVVRDCRVTGLTSPFGQGIEVRNAAGRPRTVVEGCAVRGGQEGIVSHVSRIEVRANHVTGTTMRGITITEMSEGLAEGNLIERATGSGVYCGDMSHCEIPGNTIRDLRSDGSGVRSRSGQAVVGWYYSTLRVRGNRLDVDAAAPVDVFHGTVLTERFPLSVWELGWRGTLGGIPVLAAGLAVLLALRAAAGRLLRLAGRPRPAPGDAAAAGSARAWRSLALPLAAGWLVQAFHMVEHVAQVLQTYVWQAEHRSGLLGRSFDMEWVHFLYNGAVLAFLALLWHGVRRGGLPLRRGGRCAAYLAAALALQGYHMIEHALKLFQHLRLGIDPAPGLLGGAVGLVWFHMAINLAVFAGMTVGVAGVAAVWWADARSDRAWRAGQPPVVLPAR